MNELKEYKNNKIGAEGSANNKDDQKSSGKKNQVILGVVGIAIAAALIGGMVGYNIKPVAKTDDLVVTEDVSGPVQTNTPSSGLDTEAETLKPYTQITSIMDNARHVVEERYYAADGSIVACEDGYAIMRKEYDDNGNVVSTAYFDTADQPFLVEKLGYASISMSYDDAGNKIGETYYDTSGTVISLENKNYAGVRYTYDENKNITSEEFYDTDDNPIFCEKGYHRGVYTWDEDKHKLTERYYDTEGKLVVTASGYAGVDHEYDEAGNDKKCIYIDVNGNIGPKTDGTIIVKRTYNDLKQVVKEEYRDADNKRTIHSKLGYCIIEKEYDEAGNVSREL